MVYKYITSNNLVDKQDYMYSEFGGADFLHAYMLSREKIVAQEDHCYGHAHNSRNELCAVKSALQEGKYYKVQDILDSYVKRFEVSKRLYNEYNEKWKMAENSSYTELDIYFLLAQCCVLAYKATNCTKYLSCLLKLDDMLISISDTMTGGQKKELKQILKQELEETNKLKDKLKVNIDDFE